jgi:Fe2+ transport system protein FeoA
MNATLNDLHVGQKAKVIKVNGVGKVRRRLLDMGLTPGAKLYLRKKAPLGDPIEITIRNYELTLRKSEALFIEIEVE